ncbi:unnamed protein product [Darwinula stevensoni]|uniref:Phosphatidic acid phosphatase type 2/haloperoxidase domain-containing protein n=1 Tax=Darwinula stevensoni TaxID=69355 RepID=A0A7R8X6B7_9CRUS|nr:unnamed protein product [Darwinula stevensoni]CAG0887465.1 unnamed protein product [Darwinula stevensoni]
MVAYTGTRGGRDFGDVSMERSEDEFQLVPDGDLEAEGDSPHFTPPWRPESPILPRVINIRWKWVHRLSTVVLILMFLGKIPPSGPRKWGFYCNDPAISHKFTGDTITPTCLLSVTYFGILALILLLECFKHEGSEESIKGRIKTGFWFYSSFLVGSMYTLFLTEVLKSLMGMPRPHFMDTCLPDHDPFTCDAGERILEYQCQSERETSWYQGDSYKSFPSGHASLSASTATFMIYYLRQRCWDWSFISVPLQVISMLWAVVVGASRVIDRRHHWWDVLVGDVIGFFITAGILIIYHSQVRQRKEQRLQQQELLVGNEKDKAH